MTADQRLALISGSSTGTTGAASSSSGTAFVATNPTPGTAITFAINATFSATAGAFMAMKNEASEASGTEIWLDYIKLMIAVVPPNGVNLQYAYYIDSVGSNRYTSGGSQITPANPNGNDTTRSQAALYAGALTTAAAGSSARLASRGTLAQFIPKIYDEFVIDFGGGTGGSVSKTANTAGSRIVVAAPQVILAPGQWGLLHLWSTTSDTTAPQYEFEHTWVEVAPA